MTATTELPTLANLTVIPPVYFLLGTSVAVLFLCLSLLLWRRSSSKGSKKASDHSRRKPVTEETPEDDEPADETRKKVTILFGTQTGTAEGFAKALAEEGKARYDNKVVFKVVDLDEYGADDQQYENKMKKEKIAFFTIATYGDGEPTNNATRFHNWLMAGITVGILSCPFLL
jgi:NADPH-ferrihemoprotein reductase